MIFQAARSVRSGAHSNVVPKGAYKLEKKFRAVNIRLALGVGAALVSAGALAEPIDLTGIGYVQYGDAQSYSLPIACVQIGVAYQNCPYNVQSTPGHINDLAVLGTGPGGTQSTNPVKDNIAGMDNAYDTPNNNSSNFMRTGPALEPGGAGEFTGDTSQTWDTTLAALKDFLAGSDMVVFFNNNQTNNLGTAAESLAGWAQVKVVGPGGTLGTFDFTNMGGEYDLVSQGGGGVFLGDVTTYTSTGAGPSGSTNASTDYVLSGGAICVDTTTAIPVPVPCDASNPDISAPIAHNLGADHAAYALVFPELNALLNSLFSNPLLDLTQYAMQVDYRIGCDPALFGTNKNAEICDGDELGWGKNLTNGYEQIFISQLVGTTQVPEPSALLLLALGMLGLGWSWRRSARA